MGYEKGSIFIIYKQQVGLNNVYVLEIIANALTSFLDLPSPELFSFLCFLVRDNGTPSGISQRSLLQKTCWHSG